jgi:protein phosphatase
VSSALEVFYAQAMPEEREKSCLAMAAAGDTHVGGRAFNEDAILLRPDLDLYLVADGAGGHNAGNVASALATSAIAHYFEETAAEAGETTEFDVLGLPTAARRLATAIHRANREIIEAQKTSERHHGMGTTIVAAVPCAQARVLHLAHVGDSRCYRLRDGRLELLTQDHTLINDVLELSPEIDEAVAAELPRNVTTRALGMSKRVRVTVRSLEMAAGDRYLLCSDGLTRVLADDEIWEQLCGGGTSEEQVRRLVDRAIAGEPTDNLAVVLVACDTDDLDVRAVPVALTNALRPPELRARPRPKPTPKAAAADDAGAQSPAIEIMMVDLMAPPAPERDSSPDLYVVPLASDPLSDNVLEALKGVVVPMVPKPRPPLATLPHTDLVRCLSCGDLVEGSTEWCPHCGGRIR